MSGRAAGACPKQFGIILLFNTLLSCVYNVGGVVQSAVIDGQTGKLVLKEGIQADNVAWASFTNDIAKSGWAQLEVTTSAAYDDALQAYAAGAVEGAVTSQLISDQWKNTVSGYCVPGEQGYDPVYCKKLQDYIVTNLQWVAEQIEKEPSSPYWHQVQLALLQVQGMEDAYSGQLSFPTKVPNLKPFGFLLFQMVGDLFDLEAALNKSSPSRTLGSGSCSALVKLLPGNEELLVAHATWDEYTAMLRILKKYSFSFHLSPKGKTFIPGAVQAFSSYPGAIFSTDDFYILSSGLIALETTIDNSNPALWKYVVPEGTVMAWLRNIAANRLANTGKEWADVFSKFNSGTYNNQWMIVDYKLFKPGSAYNTQDQLFTVLEQMPGSVVVEDKTKELYNTGYWASYNIPYYKEVFDDMDYDEMVKKYGSWFSHNMSPRAQIFRRDQTSVTDLKSMVKLMRYNNYEEDPLSECEKCDPKPNAANAIASRCDLNPANGTYPFRALGQRPHGATDMKVTSFSMYKEYEMLAVSGPTWDQVPAFQWSTSPYSGLLHMGHPDRWDFATVHVRWSTD